MRGDWGSVCRAGKVSLQKQEVQRRTARQRSVGREAHLLSHTPLTGRAGYKNSARNRRGNEACQEDSPGAELALMPHAFHSEDEP